MITLQIHQYKTLKQAYNIGCSVTQSCWTLCNPMDYSMPGFPDYQQVPELAQTTSIKLVMPSKHLVLCHPLLLWPSIFSRIRVFSNESVLCIRWPKWWGFSFSISPSSDYSGLISFRIEWFDLLAVQGTPKSLFQYHSSKASILWHSTFFMVQLSHPYMTTGKTIALTRWTFLGNSSAFGCNVLKISMRSISSVVPFSSCLQSFPVSGSFLMSQLFASGGQSIGASASASVLPMNI